jgi:hypothetical protein
MSRKDFREDVPTLLYLFPFILNGLYGIYLWAKSGPSADLTNTVYLTVTRDPYVFAAGTLAVLLGAVVEVSWTELAGREAKAKSVATTLQIIALASVILALFSAWYFNGFRHISGTVNDFIVGRFSIVFPSFMVLMSYLMTVRVKTEALLDSKVLGVIAMVLAPAAVYEIGKHYTSVGLTVALILILVGAFMFLRSGGKKTEQQPK